MLRLTIVAPNKQKAEIECASTDTFGDVKGKVFDALGVPPDKQRLICSGKERKDNKETLASAKVAAKSKIILMLAPGYEMPAPPTKDSGTTGAGAVESGIAVESAGEPGAVVEKEGELPMPSGIVPAENGGGIVHVRQAKNRYHVRVRQGLAAATFGDLADFLVSAFFADRGVGPAELRFLVRGKTAQRSDPLACDGVREASVMLLFQEKFHLAEEGAAWLKERLVELADLEEQIVRLGKRIEANFSGEETSLQLAEVRGAVETMEQSVESVRVREIALPQMQEFHTRVLAAKERLDVLRKGVKL